MMVNPIAGINPYQNKWCIRARVTNKSAVRHYNTSRGEGDVFSVDLADESGEIKATGFNAEAHRFHQLFEVDKVSGGVFVVSGQEARRQRELHIPQIASFCSKFAFGNVRASLSPPPLLPYLRMFCCKYCKVRAL